jgi:hypothetical protein
VNIFEVYKTPILHYQRSFDRASKFIKKEILSRVIEADEGQTRYMIFNLISKKGSALFKNLSSKLDMAFGKLDLEESLRQETEKMKAVFRRELDMQLRAFKQFVDMNDNEKAAEEKEQQTSHQGYRLAQELAAMMIITRMFYVKLEQEENAFPIALAV